MMRRTMPYVLVLAGLAAGACGKKAEPEQPQPMPEQPPSRVPTTPPPPSNSDAERLAAIERMRTTLAAMVFFDYDRSDLTATARTTLDSKVQVLRENPDVRIRIEGHADERGSVEYNLALGMRRAAAVRDYLAGFGLDASRLAIETAGEDRPLAQGQNEAAWSRNRRAEFVVTAGLTANR